MEFKKASINGKSYGDYLDQSGNIVEITEVRFHMFYQSQLGCLLNYEPLIFFYLTIQNFNDPKVEVFASIMGNRENAAFFPFPKIIFTLPRAIF